MISSDIRIGDIPIEEFKRFSDSEKLDMLFVLLAGRLKDHEARLSNIVKRKRLDTVFSGLCGFVGGFAAVLTKYFKL